MMNRQAFVAILAISVLALALGLIFLAPRFTANSSESAEYASLLNPLKQQEVTTGFTIAELYQAMHQDIAAGLYDEAGILNPAQWTYDELAGACRAAITLAKQKGRNRFAPTPTPPLDRLETYAYARGTSKESDGTTTTVKTFPQVAAVRASYVQPTPGKINRSPVRVDATSWDGWKGRPIAIVADGVAVLQTPKGTKTDAYLTVLTGPLPDVSQQTALARLPLPPPAWDAGISTLQLHGGSGRVLLASNAIPTKHRTAVLHISTGPLPDCGSLNLRWELPAVVVVRALTGQPHQDW